MNTSTNLKTNKGGMNNRSRRMISWSLGAAFFLWFFLPLIHLHAETRSMGTVVLVDSKEAQTSHDIENLQENNQETPKGMVKVIEDQATKNLTDKKKKPVNLQPFYIDQNVVTYSEYERIMGEPPPGRYPGGESPVLSLTHRQAKDYCNRVGKRLPNVEEWEMTWGAGYRWHNPWVRHRANAYRGGNGFHGGYPSEEYSGDGYGYYGKQGAWSYGSDDFSVYRDSHYSDDIYSKYGLRCAQ